MGGNKKELRNEGGRLRSGTVDLNHGSPVRMRSRKGQRTAHW